MYQAQDRDVMIINAMIHTMDPTDATHTTLLMRGGKIAALGDENTVRQQASSSAEVVNASGRAVVPGFIDAHNHMSVAAFEPVSVDCSTPPLTNLSEVLATIAEYCTALPAGQWVRGFGFNAARVSEGRGPTRHELDEAAPHNPFFLLESNCHRGYANSSAMVTAGITEDSRDPWGGQIERDHRGRPNGTLYEAAINLPFSASWGSFQKENPEQSLDLLEKKAREYLAVGITGIGDACVTTSAARIYREADAAGRLPVTLQQLHGGDHFFSRQDLDREDIVARIQAAESARLRGGTMKIFLDRAYPDGPALEHIHDGCTRHVGTPFYGPEEVESIAVAAADRDIDLAIHAMGNGAVDTIVDTYREVRRRTNDDRILRMEHAFIAAESQAGALASAGVDLVANPGLAFDDGLFFDSWRGEGQTHLKVLPLRSMFDAGVRVSFASDYPCGGFSPAQIMWSSVARLHASGALIDPEEAVSPREALRAYTINPAHASGRAAEEGSIEVGKRANVVVLDRDPLNCSTEELREMKVERTYVDGLLAFSDEQQN